MSPQSINCQKIKPLINFYIGLWHFNRNAFSCAIDLSVTRPNNYFHFSADDDCTDSFTLNQVARMHCYLDLIYQTWQPDYRPPPVPMSPQVVEQGQDSITVEWFPPISGHFYDRWTEVPCGLFLQIYVAKYTWAFGQMQSDIWNVVVYKCVCTVGRGETCLSVFCLVNIERGEVRDIL